MFGNKSTSSSPTWLVHRHTPHPALVPFDQSRIPCSSLIGNRVPCGFLGQSQSLLTPRVCNILTHHVLHVHYRWTCDRNDFSRQSVMFFAIFFLLPLTVMFSVFSSSLDGYVLWQGQNRRSTVRNKLMSPSPHCRVKQDNQTGSLLILLLSVGGIYRSDCDCPPGFSNPDGGPCKESHQGPIVSVV